MMNQGEGTAQREFKAKGSQSQQVLQESGSQFLFAATVDTLCRESINHSSEKTIYSIYSQVKHMAVYSSPFLP